MNLSRNIREILKLRHSLVLSLPPGIKVLAIIVNFYTKTNITVLNVVKARVCDIIFVNYFQTKSCFLELFQSSLADFMCPLDWYTEKERQRKMSFYKQAISESRRHKDPRFHWIKSCITNLQLMSQKILLKDDLSWRKFKSN